LGQHQLSDSSLAVFGFGPGCWLHLKAVFHSARLKIIERAVGVTMHSPVVTHSDLVDAAGHFVPIDFSKVSAVELAKTLLGMEIEVVKTPNQHHLVDAPEPGAREPGKSCSRDNCL